MKTVTPAVFADLVRNIRNRFVEDPWLRVGFTELVHLTALLLRPVRRPWRSLINERFLEWRDDQLTRADLPVGRMRRQSA